MRMRSVLSVAVISATLGALLWYRVPLRSTDTEVLFFGLWLTWVLVATIIGTALVPFAHPITLRLVRWTSHRPPVERRVLLALAVTIPASLIAGGLVGLIA
jgi:ethanolamine transporter EutH